MHLINMIVNYLYRKYGISLHQFLTIGAEVQAILIFLFILNYETSLVNPFPSLSLFNLRYNWIADIFLPNSRTSVQHNNFKLH